MRLLPEDRDLGWAPYAWLAYLAFFFAEPVQRGASPAGWAVTLAACALFLVLYFRAFWEQGPRLLWYVAGIAALGLGFAPSNPGSSAFIIYAASFIGGVGRPAQCLAALGALLGAVAAASWGLHLDTWFWLPAGLLSLVVGGGNIHFIEVGRAHRRLRASQAEVEHLAGVAERERIGRDLHDLLGHTLSLITLKAELASRLVARDPARAGAEIREIERISREALSEVRSAVAGYRSEGLRAEMARARLALDSAGIRSEYLLMPVTLGAAEEQALSLALREAVTNVIRHSGAAICSIALEQTDAGVRLAVRDDGPGGPAGRGSGEVPADGPVRTMPRDGDGLGLAAMRDRINGLGGEVERRCGRGGQGTDLLVTLPRRPGGQARPPRAVPGEAASPTATSDAAPARGSGALA